MFHNVLVYKRIQNYEIIPRAFLIFTNGNNWAIRLSCMDKVIEPWKISTSSTETQEKYYEFGKWLVLGAGVNSNENT